jgi:hypothetical protein
MMSRKTFKSSAVPKFMNKTATNTITDAVKMMSKTPLCFAITTGRLLSVVALLNSGPSKIILVKPKNLMSLAQELFSYFTKKNNYLKIHQLH